MAEIPVERKTGGGLPWWLPLLLLLLLIPLLFFLFRGCDTGGVANTNANANANANRAVAGTTNTANATTANGTAVVTNANMGGNMTTGATNANMSGNTGTTTTGAAVTDVNLFGGTTDKATLVGRQVNFTNVKVNRVLSDKVFTVKSGSGEMFALLGDNLNAGGKEQQIKIRAGQDLVLAGDFRNVPTEEVKDETQKGSLSLNQKEYAQMKGEKIYLHVASVSDAK